MSDGKVVMLVCFLAIGGLVALLVFAINSLNSGIADEREHIRTECESRGGHVSDGIIGTERFRVCVEANGSTPSIVVPR